MAFAPLPDLGADQLERQLLDTWTAEDLFRLSQEAGRDGEPFVFYEGPPTANGKPGIHHVFSRTIKDLICRFRAMQGRSVTRIAGWDTHGLPVEIEVEKQLELKGKKEIEAYGVERFNALCREQRLHLQGRLGSAVRPDRLLARLRPSLHHVQQRVRRVGLVDPAPAA